jgi:four helix bundle protein
MEQRHSERIAQDKSFHFAWHIVRGIHRQPNDYVNLALTRQLLCSGTPVRAIVEEALGGHSRTDFVANLTIATKEARETGYWFRPIRETGPHTQQELGDRLKECDGLARMLSSIILTTRSKPAVGADSEPILDNQKPGTQYSELPGT